MDARLTDLKRLNRGLFRLARYQDFKPNSVSVGTASAALTRKAMRSGTALYDHFVRNQEDTLYYLFQMPHEWVIGTSLRPHVHVIPATAEVGGPATSLGSVYFRFRVAWTCVNSGLKMPLGAAWEESFLQVPITIGDQMEELAFGPQLTPPPQFGLSGHLHVEMTRMANAPQDDFNADAEFGSSAANLALVSVDCHGLVMSTGSRYEFSN